jgi:hypothetical protein
MLPGLTSTNSIPIWVVSVDSCAAMGRVEIPEAPINTSAIMRRDPVTAAL